MERDRERERERERIERNRGAAKERSGSTNDDDGVVLVDTRGRMARRTTPAMMRMSFCFFASLYNPKNKREQVLRGVLVKSMMT